MEGNLVGENSKRTQCSDNLSRVVEETRQEYKDVEKEDECGICMESGANMVLPNCGHSMCINCFHDWYVGFNLLSLHTFRLL